MFCIVVAVVLFTLTTLLHVTTAYQAQAVTKSRLTITVEDVSPLLLDNSINDTIMTTGTTTKLKNAFYNYRDRHRRRPHQNYKTLSNDNNDDESIESKDIPTSSVSQVGPAFYWPLSTKHHCRFQWPFDPLSNESNNGKTQSLANTLNLANDYDDATLIAVWPKRRLYYAASEHARQMKDAGLPTVRRLVLLVLPSDSKDRVEDNDLRRLDEELRQEDAQRVRQQNSQLVLSVVVDKFSHAVPLVSMKAEDTLLWNRQRVVEASHLFLQHLHQSLSRNGALLFTAEPVEEIEVNIAGISEYVATNWILFLVVTICAGYVLIQEDPPTIETITMATAAATTATATTATSSSTITSYTNDRRALHGHELHQQLRRVSTSPCLINNSHDDYPSKVVGKRQHEYSTSNVYDNDDSFAGQLLETEVTNDRAVYGTAINYTSCGKDTRTTITTTITVSTKDSE
ncbi:hypothetical protein BDF19DRAFT_447813 [Syncephalis fuscata]|nr:hypothetical protein BDF19DRAFT_447813 [Syncephalis fuscata]